MSDLIDLTATKYGVPPQLLRAIGLQESGLNPAQGQSGIAPAVGNERGTGMMQITPTTAKGLGVDPNNPAQALDGAARYLKEGFAKFGNWDDAARYYHGGPDPKNWGPRTQGYHEAVAAKVSGNGPVPSGDNPFRRGGTGAPVAEPSNDNPFRVAPQKATPSGPPPETSQLLGAYQGLMRPIDNAATWLDKGANAIGIPTDKIAKALGMPTTSEANAAHKGYIKGRMQQGDRPGGLGDFAGSALGTAMATLATKNPWAGGAISGALDTTTPNDLEGTLTDASIGGLGGGVASKVIGGVSRMISPKVDDMVAALQKYGVQMTPGQILGKGWQRAEDALSSIPVLGDLIKGSQRDSLVSLNKAAINDTLSSIGAKLPDAVKIGRESVDYAHRAVSGAYDAIIPKLKNAMPDKQFVGDLGGVAKDLGRLPKEKAEQFKAIMNSTFWHRFMGGPNAPKGAAAITGAEFKDADSILGKEMRRFMKSPDPDHQLMGEMLAEAQSSLRGLMERANPGQVGGQLAKANQAWAKLLRVEGAAGSLGAKEGVFTPAQLASAVKRFDESLRKNQYARGGALMQDLSEAANARLPSSVPDSGTAGRLLTAGGLGALATGGPAAAALLGAKGALAAVPLAPYFPGLRKGVGPLMTGRPPLAKELADILSKTKGPLVPLAATGAVSLKERNSHGK